jgi:hypothetical protein
MNRTLSATYYLHERRNFANKSKKSNERMFEPPVIIKSPELKQLIENYPEPKQHRNALNFKTDLSNNLSTQVSQRIHQGLDKNYSFTINNKDYRPARNFVSVTNRLRPDRKYGSISTRPTAFQFA